MSAKDILRVFKYAEEVKIEVPLDAHMTLAIWTKWALKQKIECYLFAGAITKDTMKVVSHIQKAISLEQILRINFISENKLEKYFDLFTDFGLPNP